jgi:prepilin-type N-terminal cleavage/methylation domain-containing protein
MIPPRRRSSSGFTLIELLVAIALMTILTGSVVFIFIQSQKIFLTVDARVQVYQYARYAFDQMERDLANVVRSSDMEFFDDIPALPGGRPGRYDMGEEIPIRGTEDNAGLYNHSFTLRQPRLYTALTDQLQYRHDSIYFKTVTSIGGQTVAALVEYVMVDTDKERPKLVKRVWRVTGLDSSNPGRPKYQINGSPGDQATPITQDLCLYTVEARFELFVRNRRKGHVGDYYDCNTLVNPPTSPPPIIESFKNDAQQPGDTAMQTYFHHYHDASRAQPDLGILDPAEGGLFRTEYNFTFPMLKEGDRIYIYGGGMPKDYTIEKYCRPDGTVFKATDPVTDLRIKFKEPIDWPVPPGGGPPSTMRVNWDASFLPPALRASLKIKDSKSLENRSVQRVFKILSN